MSILDSEMEQALLTLVSEKVKKKYRLNIKRYQTSTLWVYDSSIVNQILKACEFKDIGNIYDFPKIFPQPKLVSGYELTANFKKFKRIAVSKKLNSVVIYTFQDFAFECGFIIDTKYLKKFSKIVKPIIRQDYSEVDIFQDVNFKCKAGEYIEVSKAKNNSTKPISATKKTIPDEKLIFEYKSTLKEVIDDITSFFSSETKELYKRMEIPYKRGALLYGPPGTGKSALIREMIRRIGDDVSKIIINPNVSFDVTYILSSLLRSLNGNPAIIIIEDMDSLINPENRSEFLNLLDGIDVKSGSYIIGTTNYPERIDPAFINRSGRFDRSYKIGNPTYKMRKLFFESKNVDEIFNTQNVSDIFAKYTDKLPIASLKEVITSTKYTLVSNPNMNIEEAIKISASKLKEDKEKHAHENSQYLNNINIRKVKGMMGNTPNIDDDEEDDEEDLEENNIQRVKNYIKIIKKDNAEVEFSILP